MIESDSFGRALDTTPEAWAYQVARWRVMSPAEKVELVAALTREATELAEAGIAARYPTASARERFLRLAILRLGRALALQVYPEGERLAL